MPANSIPFKSFVPLDEIIAEVKGVMKNAKQVEREYLDIVTRFGSEFNLLAQASPEDLRQQIPKKIAEGIIRVRERNIEAIPGFDGEYGKIKIFGEEEKQEKEQLTLF